MTKSGLLSQNLEQRLKQNALRLSVESSEGICTKKEQDL